MLTQNYVKKELSFIFIKKEYPGKKKKEATTAN